MPAATRTRWPTGSTANPWTYPTGLNYQCSKLFFGSPDYPTNSFLITYVGFQLTEGGNAPQETQSPNADTVIDQAFFVHPNGTEYPIDFIGQEAATVTAATGVVHGTVTLPQDLPGWSVYGIRTIYHGAELAQRCGVYRIQRHRGEKYWGAGSLAAVQALATANGASTAALDPDSLYNTLGNATNSQIQAYGPSLICAKGWDGRPVPLVTGDSLIERQEIAASADARGNMGMLRRWVDQRDDTYGSYIPIVMGVPGGHDEYELATNAYKRWDLLDAIAVGYNSGKPIWTVVADQGGRNDTNAVTTTWYNRKFGLADRIQVRYPNTTIVSYTIIPTLSASTDSGRTVNAYGILSATWHTVTGQLAAVNAAIKASPRYKSVIDMVPAFMVEGDITKGVAAEMFPLGNVTGTPGNGDGVTTWNTMVLPSTVLLGARIMFEYQPGLWTNRTLVERVTENGNGTTVFRVAEVLATVCNNPNATLLGHAYTASDLIHPALYHILRTVSRIPQSEKFKYHV
jgi:hypothetical protein